MNLNNMFRTLLLNSIWPQGKFEAGHSLVMGIEHMQKHACNIFEAVSAHASPAYCCRGRCDDVMIAQAYQNISFVTISLTLLYYRLLTISWFQSGHLGFDVPACWFVWRWCLPCTQCRTSGSGTGGLRVGGLGAGISGGIVMRYFLASSLHHFKFVPVFTRESPCSFLGGCELCACVTSRCGVAISRTCETGQCHLCGMSRQCNPSDGRIGLCCVFVVTTDTSDQEALESSTGTLINGYVVYSKVYVVSLYCGGGCCKGACDDEMIARANQNVPGSAAE